MTLNWKIIGAFSGGFALGSVISYFILKKQAEKELNDAIDREKEALQKAYEDRGAAILTAQGIKKVGETACQGFAEGFKASKTEENIENRKKVAEKVEELGYAPKIDYTKYAKSVREEFADSEYPTEEDRKNIPYLIFEDDYSNDLEYDKESLIYFAGNNTLCDVDETLFNIADTIGVEAVNLFDMMKVDTIYIRNERLQTDFMVERRLVSFVDGIMHMPHI